MGVPLTEGSSTMEKELRHDNKCYYRKQVFYDKEGLLWKKSILMGSQFYYENRILLITI